MGILFEMWKACSKCGKIHSTQEQCLIGRQYGGGKERQLRSQYSWTEKSKEIREKANYLCEVCRDNNIYTYDNIEVHHIVKVRDDESLLLDNENLICLCKEHHIQADNGEIDQDYLRELARQRESR
jgi:5-methylcytosine-specific restriction endonuclease McrA